MNLILVDKERINEEVIKKIYSLTGNITPLVDNDLTTNEIFVYFDAKRLVKLGLIENFILSNAGTVMDVDYVLELDKFKKPNGEIDVPFGHLFDKIITIDKFNFAQERLNVNGFTQISNEIIHKVINAWVECVVMCTTYTKI